MAKDKQQNDLKHVSTQDVYNKLSNDVLYLKQTFSDIPNGRDLKQDEKKEVKALLDDVVKNDKELRKRQHGDESIYSREDAATLTAVINQLSKHHIGIDDKALGHDIQYLQAHGVHNQKKDQGHSKA